jgi:predicted nucleotidyltransferase
MNIKALSDCEIKENIINIIKHYLPDSKIMLFGSRAKDINRENSDYDISIIWNKKIPLNIYFSIQEELDELKTLKTIDLVDFQNFDTDFQEIVMKEGLLLYDGTSQETVNEV